MKKLLLIMLLLIYSCGKSESSKYSIGGSSTTKIEIKKDNSPSERLIKDINGTIIKKLYNEAGEYYFAIKLDNGGLFDWKTSRIKWNAKEIGNRVHFDYLKKSRYSDKSID